MEKKSQPKTPEKHFKYLDGLIHETLKKHKPSKLKAPIIITFTIFILLCLSAISLLNTKKTRITIQSPQPTPTPRSTANWTIYQDKERNFSIYYPSDYHLTHGEYGIQLSDNCATTYVTVDTRLDAGYLPKTTENTEINGVTAKKMLYYIPQSDTPSEIKIDFDYNQREYRIGFEQKHCSTNRKNNIETFNQILSTFKFTDPASQGKILPDTTNWKTHTNNQLKFTLKYPEKWIVKEGSPTLKETTISSEDSNITILLTRLNKSPVVDLSLTEWYENLSSPKTSFNAAAKIVDRKSTSLASTNGIQLTEFFNTQSTVIYLPHSNSIFRITIKPSKAINDPTITQILSTFQFTN